MGCGNGKTIEAKKVNMGYPQCLLAFPLSSEIYSLVSLDENRLVLGGKNELQLFDYSNKSISIVSKDFKDRLNYLLKLSDGKIASAGQDRSIKIWDISQNKLLYSLSGHTSMIWCLFELKGNKLISGADDKTARIFDLNKQKEDSVFFKGNKSVTSILQLKSGKILIACGENMNLIELKTKNQIGFLNLESSVWSMIELENGEVVVGMGNGNLVILDIEPELIISKKFEKGHKKPITFIVELQDHKIVTASDENDLIEWDPNDLNSMYLVKGHNSTVTGLTFISGRRFASVSKDKELRIWE